MLLINVQVRLHFHCHYQDTCCQWPWTFWLCTSCLAAHCDLTPRPYCQHIRLSLVALLSPALQQPFVCLQYRTGSATSGATSIQSNLNAWVFFSYRFSRPWPSCLWRHLYACALVRKELGLPARPSAPAVVTCAPVWVPPRAAEWLHSVRFLNPILHIRQVSNLAMVSRRLSDACQSCQGGWTVRPSGPHHHPRHSTHSWRPWIRPAWWALLPYIDAAMPA